MNDPDTIVAVSTPPGEGGVGIVRLSGPQAIGIGRHIFLSRRPLGERVRYVEFGRVLDAEGKEMDTALAWVFTAPCSYTGEDTVEISCHGSPLVLETLVQTAIARGAVLAAPGEFSRRAFLNGRLDLIQAEAVVDLIQASTRSHLENAYGQASGRLSTLVRQLKDHVVKAVSLVELNLDFSEEDLQVERDEVLGELQSGFELASRLVETFEGTRRRQRGFLIALVGQTNVGKSTLINALLGEERAIVSPIPGTTRDLIEGYTIWRGEAVRLVDTAGIRQGGDWIEREGVQRAIRIAESSDCILALLDASRPWQDEDGQVLSLLQDRPGLIVLNKGDLPRQKVIPPLYSSLFDCVEISALTGAGLNLLQQRAMEKIPPPTLVDGVGITRQRHHQILLNASSHLSTAQRMFAERQLDECVVAELQETLSGLGEMLGQSVEEAVLDRIFSEFCIGK